MEDGSARALLLSLAKTSGLALDPGQEGDLQTLLGLGLLKPADPPHLDAMDRKFDDLRARHQHLLEAKAVLVRLSLRIAPRSGLHRWIKGGDAKPPGPEDQDLLDLDRRLRELGLVVRDVNRPTDLLGRLNHIKDRIMVEDRECLDRMADVDRAMEAAQKLGLSSIQVDPFGWVTFTAAGERELPEWAALQDLEAVLNLVSGPRRQKIDDYSLFRHDPGNLLAFLLENPSRTTRLAEAVQIFEDLAEPFEYQTAGLGVRSTRIRNAFLIRLLRINRQNPKAAFAWANRERLRALADQAKGFLPASMTGEGWPLIYGLDVLVAGPPEVTAETRRELLETILLALAKAFPEQAARDGQGIRLAFAMLQAVLERRLQSASLVERYVQVMAAATQEGRKAAPQDLPDEGSRLIFGYHLAHLSGFIPTRVPDQVARFTQLESALGNQGQTRGTPLQVVLHGMMSLERLARLDLATSVEEYAATFLRVRAWIQRHKDLGRAFHNEHGRAEDIPFLAANVTAQAYFSRAGQATQARAVADVGVSAAYEAPDRSAAPLLGQPFGTLMLQ